MSTLVKTSVGLRVEGNDEMPWDVWVEFGDHLKQIEGAVQFWIGDWLNYGEGMYGEKYAQAVDPAQAKTWTNYAYVARSVDISRRREIVAYTKHAAIAALSAEDQVKFLDECERNGYTVKQLKAAISGEEPTKQTTTCPECGHVF